MWGMHIGEWAKGTIRPSLTSYVYGCTKYYFCIVSCIICRVKFQIQSEIRCEIENLLQIILTKLLGILRFLSIFPISDPQHQRFLRQLFQFFDFKFLISKKIMKNRKKTIKNQRFPESRRYIFCSKIHLLVSNKILFVVNHNPNSLTRTHILFCQAHS